jgi:hypothetical protein
MKTTDLVEMQQRLREVARPMTEALEMTVSARAIAADFTENFRNLVLPDHLHSPATLATDSLASFLDRRASRKIWAQERR